MMTLQEVSIRQSALGWVKKAIDDNLGEIEADLKQFIEDGDTALLESVKQRLGTVQGVLMMIEQYGSAMLTEEMVALADYVAEQDQNEPALEVLLRAVLQLPDYLEHIQSGHRDIPIAILPLLNDIRAVRNQDLFSEKLLFLPDLSMHQEGADVEAIDAQQNQASKLLAKKLRPVYQLALLNVIQEKSVDESLQRLEKVCETLEERSFSEQIARIWWIVGALLESVSRGQLELGVSIKNLLGKVDALFRVILIIGEGGLVRRQPIELIKNFLYYLAQPECDGPKTQAIKTAYRLEQFLPSESARSKLLDNIAGPNQALLKTVAEAMRTDIEAVKSTLEVYVNGDLGKVEQLKDLPQEMHVISDTLAMIGLGQQRQLVETQIETVKQIVSGATRASEEQLLAMAAELLQVEQALDQMQKRAPVEPPRTEADISRDYEMDNVLTAVVTATLDDIQKTKNAILEFIKDPEKRENIDLCLALMQESRGALELMNQPRAVAVVDGLLSYLRGYDVDEFMQAARLDALSQVVVSLEYYLEALGEHRGDADTILDFADAQLHELLADVDPSTASDEVARALPSIDDEPAEPAAAAARTADDGAAAPTEVAAVAQAEGEPAAGPETVAAPGVGSDAEREISGSPPGDVPLEAAAESAAAENGPARVAPEATDDTLTSHRSGLDLVSETPLPVADEAAADEERETRPASSPAAPVATIEIEAVNEDLEVLRAGSDPDILEIYLEEAEEESRNIARLQQDWMLHPEDENALKNIRRAFHTIKGSGRLVGAMKIGEFAWDYEQLLNRVIDRTIPPNDEIIAAVGKAARALPELVEELKNGTAPKADLPHLRGLARALAEFRAEQVLIEHTMSMTGLESPHDRITDSDAVQAETAVERSETGADDTAAGVAASPPQESNNLLAEIEPDTMQVDPNDLVLPESPELAEPAPRRPGNLDDTLLAQRFDASLPGTGSAADAEAPRAADDFEAAVDYADDDVEIDEPAADIGAFDDAGEEPREVIEIETMGEDFIGDALDEGFGEDVALDDAAASMLGDSEESADPTPTMPAAESAAMDAADEIEFEALDVEVPSAMDDDGELEFEALEIEAPDAGTSAPDSVDTQPRAEPVESDESPQEPDASPPDEPFARSPAEPPTATQGAPHDPFVGTTRRAEPGDEARDSETPTGGLAEPTDLSFDPELLTIYQQEVEQHLNIVNSALDQAEQVRELVPGEKLYRALHTIHGASRTADISTIGEFAGLLEKPLKSAFAQNMALDHEIVALYREGQRALQAMTHELVATRRLPQIPRDLAISLQALADDLEEHTVEIPEEEAQTTGEFIDTLTMMTDAADGGQDDELLSIFVEEATELLEMSDNTLHHWSQQDGEDTASQDYSAVMELQRYLHTLKGGARMAELKEISDLAHEMESMFIAVIDGRVDKDENLTEALRDCFDLLHTQVTEARENRPLSDASALVARLADLRRRDGDGGSVDLLEEGIDADSEDIDIVAENLTGESLAGGERATQDVIKVRSDLLDNLVNAAGEVSIYRARMEQQVAGLGSHLGELGQTIARLKSQLRSLEAETDAQIHYSHRAEARREGDFDPLEMDRYTMIQELSRSLSESVNDLSSLQHMLGEQVKDSETLLLQQSRVNTDLQDGLIKSRMVRFSGLLSRLRRLVRQSSQEVGKKAELLVSGEETEVDNKVLDRMVAPLEHIIRNALSHGIETPVERVKKGKPETGRITIDISRDGSDVVIRVSDDGAGVNIEKVRSRAIQLGLLDESRQISDEDLVQYILEPGFSTADHVTQLSGRGVGMDVVDIEIKQLGGTLQIETTPQGTAFVARLPFTLSINQAILVRTGEETYAIPLINIEGITRLDSPQLAELYRQENPELEYAGQQFALHPLSRLVDGSSHFRGTPDDEKQPIIFSRAGEVRVALHVDEILGNREIVVKTLGKQLSQVKGLAGASILADGSVVLILDINGLVRKSAATPVKITYRAGAEGAGRGRETVMVVDDSITMRRVASKLLERHNYDVVTAKDGVDALAQLEDVRPDVMLLDIEMPRMDGFELATHMRNEASYSGIPIIMITSRTGEKHRDRAFEIGVTKYMGKPYQEEELIENIENALRAS